MASARTPNSRASRDAATAVAPLDVRLMNGVAAALAAVVLLVLAWQTVRWATRSPVFTVRAIELEAAALPNATSLQRSSVAAMRAVALPRLAGNFFSLDLDKARAAFEAVPWVRRAVVRRVWPNRLSVTLEEHEAAALWQGDGRRNERLVNTHGEVFEANNGDVEDQDLPTLAGADVHSARMLGLLQRLNASLAPLDQSVSQLRLSPRGSWRAALEGGARLELGRGSDDELVARVDRLARTLPQVAARFQSTNSQPRALLLADLRHPDGYALRLAGVSTADKPGTANTSK